MTSNVAFRSNLDRNEAERVLNATKEMGKFVLRPSSTGEFVLSFMDRQLQIKHLLIHVTQNGFKIDGVNDKQTTTFTNPERLVQVALNSVGAIYEPKPLD